MRRNLRLSSCHTVGDCKRGGPRSVDSQASRGLFDGLTGSQLESNKMKVSYYQHEGGFGNAASKGPDIANADIVTHDLKVGRTNFN